MADVIEGLRDVKEDDDGGIFGSAVRMDSFCKTMKLKFRRVSWTEAELFLSVELMDIVLDKDEIVEGRGVQKIC